VVETKRINFSLRYRTTDANSRYGLLLRYLNGSFSKSRRDALKHSEAALCSFWMPFALHAAGTAQDEVQQAAKQAISQLVSQIHRIAMEFDVELPVVGGVSFVPPAVMSVMPAVEDRKEPTATDPIAPPDGKCKPVFIEDSELLGSILSDVF